jgi:cytochrome c-type biogenesis protein
MPGATTVFVASLAILLAAWVLLALLYSGIGGGTNVAEARRVISSVTSSRAVSGQLDIQAIVATPEYFRVTDRSDEIVRLAPEENLATLSTSPGAFDVFDESADALAVDPESMLPVLLIVELHEGQLPDPSTWLRDVALMVDGEPVPPAPSYTTAFKSEHHQTLALEFPRTDESGNAILSRNAGTLDLRVPDIATGTGYLTVQWPLPLQTPDSGSGGWLSGSAATLGGVIAIMAGLLVVFSPCVVHMTAYFLPVVTGLGMREILDRKGDVAFRAHVALSGLAFVAGFVVLYTAFGVAAGFAGHFFSNTAQMQPFLLPFRILTGVVIIYLAFQTLGVFRIPFVMSLQLPGRPHRGQTPRQGYIAAAIAGMSISMGCLVCVGGTLLASLLAYAGASGSPLVGGVTLLLFSIGMSIPFLMAAFAFDKVLPRFDRARSLIRYSAPVAGAVMMTVGLLILSGNDFIFERLVV